MVSYHRRTHAPTSEAPPRSYRVLAGVIDFFVIYVAQFGGAYMGAIIGGTIMAMRDAHSSVIEDAMASGLILGWVFWGIAAVILNHGVLQGMNGSTIGKSLCGLRVEHDDGRPIGVIGSMARTLCYIVSALPANLGFFAMFWSRRGRCWHDRICRTVVISKPSTRLPRVIMLPAIDGQGQDREAA